MPVRHRHKIGDHLVQDDDTGITHYGSQMVELWDGRVVHKNQYETRQPQEFVKAFGDPYPAYPIRVAENVPAACVAAPVVVGNTTIPYGPKGPAWHIYDVGIGEMKIGCSFVIR